jgi:sirohydrochlorin ferrochelatase
MKPLVIVAHGSRREASNEEVRQFSEQVYVSLKDEYPLMNTGYLELAEPLIPESIIDCIKKGATSVKVLPYFLSAGRHVQEDVPREVEKVQASYPDVAIEILSYVGGLQSLPKVVTDYVKSTSVSSS